MLRIVSAQRINDNPDELNDPNLKTPEPVNDNLPVVTPENVGQYIEPEEDVKDVQTEAPPQAPVEPFEPQIEEQQYAPEVVEDSQSLIQRAIQEQQCIAFEYTSVKNGNYLGWRLLEPAGTFIAGTGNELLVSWDRHRGDVRAFAVKNIHPGTLKFMPGEFYHFEPKFIFSPK